MGMDVWGLAPKSKKGEHFRNNIWWWRPLWTFCESVDPSLTEKVPNAQYNDGDGLKTPEEAEELGKKLMELVNNGTVAEEEKRYNEWKSNLPLEDCELCNSTGIRPDDEFVQGQDKQELAPEMQIILGRTHGWCNGCNGVGTKTNWMANYPFSAENVKEFAEFLIECGGFEIY